MLQQPEGDDYVLATGRSTTVRRFCEAAFRAAGIALAFEGAGLDEVGRDMATGEALVDVKAEYFRPAEVERLCGDPSKAMAKLGWRPTAAVETIAAEMVAHDLARIRADAPAAANLPVQNARQNRRRRAGAEA